MREAFSTYVCARNLSDKYTNSYPISQQVSHSLPNPGSYSRQRNNAGPGSFIRRLIYHFLGHKSLGTRFRHA